MNYLLDTCVISELVKLAADEKVTSWISDGLEETIQVSVITIGEIEPSPRQDAGNLHRLDKKKSSSSLAIAVQKGINTLPASAKKHQLQSWLDNDLIARFENRIVPIDQKVARMWGKILAQAEKKGRQIQAIDGLITATCLVYDMTVVTRNVSDMQVDGLSVFNPWEEV